MILITNEIKSNINYSISKKDEGDEIMKNIRKRKDGRWEGRKQYKNKKYFVIANTKQDCINKFRKMLSDLKKESKLTYNNYSLKEWWTYWQETYKKNFVGQKTYSTIEYLLKVLEKDCPELIDKKIKTITTDMLQISLNKIPPSRSKELLCTYLNACLEKAKKLQKILHNPFENVIKDKKLNKIKNPFTYSEQVTIIENLKGTTLYEPIMIYLLTGLRKNELNHKDIENDIMADNTLRVICEKKRDNKIVYRYIDLTDTTKNFILNNLDKLRHTPDYYAKQFKKFLTELNINGSLHTLRHTFTTNHLYLGTPDKFIQEWLGHEDILITKKHYMSIDRTLSKEKLLNLYGDYYYIVNK